MTGLDAGKLRHRVSLEQRVETQDPVTGEVSTSWELVSLLWANVRPKSAKQLLEAKSLQSVATVDVTIRYRSDLVDSSMRFLHRGKVLNIEGGIPDHISGLEWLTVPCSEGLNAG